MKLLRRAIVLYVLCALLSGFTVAETDFSFDEFPDTLPSVLSEPVIEIYVTLTDKVALGATDNGERFIVPITGGHFTGKGLQGKVVPGGADWQQIRADGVKQIVARYSLRTDDGHTIMVDNRGIVRANKHGAYRLTFPKFYAPEGKYEWMNQSLFVGTITSIKNPRAVVIRAYELQ